MYALLDKAFGRMPLPGTAADPVHGGKWGQLSNEFLKDLFIQSKNIL